MPMHTSIEVILGLQKVNYMLILAYTYNFTVHIQCDVSTMQAIVTKSEHILVMTAC